MRFKNVPLWLFAVVLVFISCSDDPEIITSGFATSPSQVEIIASDIDLFWEVHDNGSGVFRETDFLDNYFRGGTESLSQFFDAKIKSTNSLTNKLSDDDYHNYYLSIRSNSQTIDLSALTAALELLEENYPAAVFSNLVLVIGDLGTGGTVVQNGSMVIGVEFFTKTADSPTAELSSWVQSVTRDPSYLPSIVLHELVHIQQRNFAITQNITNSGTLLELALAEGIADYIAYKLLGIYFNDHLPAWADSHEEDLWNEFKLEMNGADTGNWLFNAASSQERPADLGYYIGFKIAEHYDLGQPNKQETLQGLLEINNASTFVINSGYDSKFN